LADDDKTDEAIDAVIDAVPTVVEALAPSIVELVGHIPGVGNVAKQLVRVTIDPSEADRSMSREDVALGVERAHEHEGKIAALEKRTAELAGNLDAWMRHLIVKERVEPLFREVARHLVVQDVDQEEIAQSPHFADALLRAYRDVSEAVDPAVAKPLARLALIYKEGPMNRAGRAIGDLLRTIEPNELSIARKIATVIAVGLAARVPLSTRLPVRCAYEPKTTKEEQDGSIRVVVGNGPTMHFETIRPEPGDALPLHVLRLLVRTEVGEDGKPWREAGAAAMTASMAGALAYVLLGGVVVPVRP
jgi:hypothetical protein